VNSKYAVVSHWGGKFNDTEIQKWASDLYHTLEGGHVSLGLVFMTPRFFPHAQQVLEILRVHAHIPLLAGCSSHGLIANGEEIEHEAGIVLGLYSLPEAQLKGVHFGQAQIEAAEGAEHWIKETGVEPGATNGWLSFLDPFHIDSESWVESWSEAYPQTPVLGGLAGGDFRKRATQVYLNGDVFDEGGVAVSVGGEVRLASVISQGCTPIGETWTLTRVNHNIIQQIGNRPAYKVLEETVQGLTADEQKQAQGNLLIGLVVNEYLEDFHRGDFLIRNLLGVDPNSGSIAVGALPRPGQTVQFQRRDAGAANEDMAELLGRAARDLKGKTVYGACLCSCSGRGSGLFGRPNHDAEMVQEELGPLGVSGFFCSGEIGPVGRRNFLHGFTASVALFVKK
jgi:small ligand-binding sensory domain FIST